MADSLINIISNKKVMIFQKIGKEEQKYNLTIKLHKATYSDAVKSKGDRHLQIMVTRGDHKLSFTTMPFKRGQIKCNKESYTVPMTLYYDVKTKKFLDKQIEVTGEIKDDLDEQQVQFDKSVINISKYMSSTGSDKFALEVQLNDEERRTCILTFHVLIVRIKQQNQQQNKSTNTNDRYQSSNEVSEDGDARVGRKGNTGKYKFKQITPSDTSSQRSVNLYHNLPPKGSKNSQAQKFIPQPAQKGIADNMNQASPYKQESQSSTQPRRKASVSNPPARTPPKPYKSSRDKYAVQRPADQKQGSISEQSQSLLLYQLQKRLKDSEKRFEMAKKQIQDQKILINKLLQQKDHQYNSTQMLKRSNQVQSLKSQLLKANLKIGQLEAKIRHLQSTEKENVTVINTKTQKAAYYEDQLTKTKLIFGRLMQRCYQTGDTDLMTFIEEELGEI